MHVVVRLPVRARVVASCCMLRRRPCRETMDLQQQPYYCRVVEHITRFSLAGHALHDGKITNHHHQQQQDLTTKTNIPTTTSDYNSNRPSPPSFVLILYGVAKSANHGTMLRSASAFGARAVIVVGQQRKHLTTFGAHGADKHLLFVFENKLEDAIKTARDRFGIQHVVGVEIKDVAKSVASPTAFTGSCAFLMGNEGDGLSAKACAVCDYFIYIRHFGAGTASLNVAVAASIVFHRFAEWAQVTETPRLGEKFVVEEQRIHPDLDQIAHKRQLRLATRQGMESGIDGIDFDVMNDNDEKQQ